MTYEEKYPNIAKLTTLLNQQKHPRRTLRALVALVGGKEEGAENDTRDHD